MKAKSLLLIAALILLVASAGCIFSPDSGDDKEDPVATTLPFAGTEDQLMRNFRIVYEDMDFNSYRDMLHPDYLMILQSSTVEEYPDVGPTLDLEEDLRMTQRMFSGEAQTNPDGELVHAITTITIDQLEQQGTWATSPANDVIPNARFGLFEVVFLFDRPADSNLSVTGKIKFYLTSRDSFHEGVDRKFWQIIGQQDLTNTADPAR